jgi:hypothetical protein
MRVGAGVCCVAKLTAPGFSVVAALRARRRTGFDLTCTLRACPLICVDLVSRISLTAYLACLISRLINGTAAHTYPSNRCTGVTRQLPGLTIRSRADWAHPCNLARSTEPIFTVCTILPGGGFLSVRSFCQVSRRHVRLIIEDLPSVLSNTTSNRRDGMRGCADCSSPSLSTPATGFSQHRGCGIAV